MKNQTTHYRYGIRSIQVTENEGLITIESDDQLFSSPLQEALLWMNDKGSRRLKLNGTYLEKTILPPNPADLELPKIDVMPLA